MEEASSIVKAIEAAWIRAEKPREFSVKVFEEPEKNFFGMVTKSAKIAFIYKNLEKKSSYKEQSSSAPKSRPTSYSQESTFTPHPKEYARKEQSRHEPITVREPAPRELREPREPREPRELREPRERREPREQREPMVREPREQRDQIAREPREQREPRERREPRNPEATVRKEYTRTSEAPVREHARPTSPAREYDKDRQSTHAAPKDREFDAADQNVQEKIFWNDEMIDITRTWIDTLLKNLNCNATFTLEAKRYYLTVSFDKPVRETKTLEQQLFRSCAYLIMQMLRTKLKKQFRGLKVVLHSPA